MKSRVPFASGETMPVAAFAAFVASRLLTYAVIVLAPARALGPFYGGLCSAVLLVFNHPIDLAVLGVFRRFGLVSPSTLPDWLLCRECGRTQKIANVQHPTGISLPEAAVCGWKLDGYVHRCPFCATENQ